MLSTRSLASNRPNPQSDRNPFSPQAPYIIEQHQQQQQGRNTPQSSSGRLPESSSTQSPRPLNYVQQNNTNLELGCIIGFSNTYRECVVAIPGNRNYYLKSFGSFMVLEDIDNRQNQILLRDHDMQISAIDVSPSGQYFVSGQEGSLKRGQIAPVFLWSLSPDIRRLAVMPGLSVAVNVLKFSPDEKYVCGCGDDCQLIIWEVATAEIVYCEKTPKPITLLTWYSPTEACYACEDSIFIFKLRYDNYSCQYAINREQMLLPPSNHMGRSYLSIALSTDNMFIYFGTSTGEVIVMRIDAKVFRQSTNVCSHGVHCLKVLPSGQILCGGGDGTVSLMIGQDKTWQVQGLATLEGRIISLSVMNEMEFIVSTIVGHVYRCTVQVQTRKCGYSLLTMSHTNPVTCLATFTASNNINTMNNNMPSSNTNSRPNSSSVFNYDSSSPLKPGGSSQQQQQQQSPQLMVVSGTVAGELRVWDVKNYCITQYTRRPKSGALLSLFVVPDYGILTGWKDGSMTCFKINDINTQMWSLPNVHRDGTTSIYVHVSTTTRFIVTGGEDGSVRVWKLENRELLSQYNGHSMKPVMRVLVDVKCNSLIHSLGADGSVASYDIKSNKFLMKHLSGSSACDMSQRLDSELELISSDIRGTLSVWDIDVRDPVLCIEDPAKTRIRVCAVSPSGRFMAFAGDEKKIKILNLKTFEIISIGESHSESVTSIIWSHDEQHIFSGGDDCCLSVWNFMS